ncbi:MAG: ribonuclease / adenosylcobalamin/alpha-ribazole phosphatase [Solirubrobacteraceae bacterium]|jgi:probable phosphoglycerate mutase|nr:ribonuclease / adenosylcobalamin/alpha-ribazole phosphatase [Solirubrobacteraceae bacterium]
MARTVTLVRHGQTESSLRMAYSGRRDIPLTDAGREQARRCAARLAGAGVDAVRTSPLVRARDTAAAIAAATGAPLDVDERLTEVDYGPFEGLDRDGALARFGKAFEDWRADPFGSPVPGMEPLTAALARARAATADALAGHEHPVIVGHQGILRIVLVALGELAPEDYFSRRLHEAEPVVIAGPQVVSP